MDKKSTVPTTYNARVFEMLEPALIEEAARAAEEDADHYEDYNVGVAVVAEMSDGSITAFTGGNRKRRRSRPGHTAGKFCAEQVAITRAKRPGKRRGMIHLPHIARAIGMVVYAGPRVDDETGIVTEVRWPCGQCREWLCKQPCISDDFIIVAVHNGNGEMAKQSLRQLLHQFVKRPT